MCNHCDDAPCMKAAGRRGSQAPGWHRDHRSREERRGRSRSSTACPYGAISWNEEKQIPQAWIFDAHLLDDGWTKTRGEQACPTQVFRTIKVDDAEMQRIQKDEGLEVLKPELGTKPRVYYKNLH
jgi:Fe-S-cluster-containing dehydrogenase component